MTAFTYFIPFTGIALNYLQTHKNEQRVISKLNHEAHERKHAEEILAGVLNSSLSSIMGLKAVRNKEGTIEDFEWIFLNPASRQIFNLDSGESVGARLIERLPFTKEEGWLSILEEVVQTDVPLNYEYFSPHLQKWLLIIAVRLEDGVAVTISDISKRKNALKELMDTEKLTVTGRIARTIAHEVRNPLTNINMSLEQLKDVLNQPDDSQKMYLDIIHRNSNRINQLITELLNSSRPAQLEMKEYSVNLLLEETLELAMDRIRLKKIKLNKDFDEALPALMLDPGKMKTALLNIIINAVEAMEEEKGELTIRTFMAGKHCNIVIEDNGGGISKENLANLFEPFFSKKSQGMGLGLFATQNIILTHKGSVDVKSVVGKGTTFTISLDPLFKG
jgi:signal transduction histidine kinase